MTSTESSEAKAGDALHAANGAGKKVEVTRRGYAYDAQGRPTSRTQAYPQQKFAREESFDYSRRSEL